MMQLYLPFSEVHINTKILDQTTLGKQCNAAHAIAYNLKHRNDSWHPGVRMWIGHETFLAFYAHRLIAEWRVLGHPDLWSPDLAKLGYLKMAVQPRAVPWWWGHAEFHETNKVALLKVDSDWYGRFLKNIDMDTIPLWPTPQRGKWIRGPKAPVGNFMIGKHPVFENVDAMEDLDFIKHANLFHFLTPDMPKGIRDNERPDLLRLLRILHERFHSQRVYTSHDHR